MTNTATISVTALTTGNLEPGQTYRIQFDEGFVKAVGGNKSPSPTLTNYASFTVPAVSLLSVSTSNIANSELSLTFDKPIISNTTAGGLRYYRIYKEDNTIASTGTYYTGTNVPGLSDYPIVPFSGNTATIKLLDKIEKNNSYYLLMDSKFFLERTGNYPAYAGGPGSSLAISNSSTVRFSTGAGPSLTSVVPSYNSTASSSTVNLTFSPDVELQSTKAIKLYKLVSGTSTLVATLNGNDNRLTKTASTVTVNLQNVTEKNTTYYITMDDGFVRYTNNHFTNDAISNDSIIKYTTTPDPAITSISPTYNSTITGVNVIVNFSQALSSGNITGWKLYKQSDNSQITGLHNGMTNTNFNIPGYDVMGGRAAIGGSGNTQYRIYVGGLIDKETDYYVTIDEGVGYYNSWPTDAITTSSTTQIKFSTGQGPHITSVSPVHNATGVSTATSVAITYDTRVTTAGEGYINLYSLVGGTSTLVANLAKTNKISVSGTGNNILNLNLSGLLSANTTYYITMSPVAVLNEYTAISSYPVTNDSVIKFTTA